jgi:hypothetical protein
MERQMTTKDTHPFTVAREAEMKLIGQIADRAVQVYAKHGVRVERLDTLMDVMAVHQKVQPLRLLDLVEADELNFIHDITGINRHLDRDNYRLNDGFSPRFSLRKAG